MSMTADDFRTLALSLEGARYASRLGAIEFLVKDTVFASLGGPNPNLAILKLTREDQARAIAQAPSLFLPQPGGAGARGLTCVRLSQASADILAPWLAAAAAKARNRRTVWRA